jgi:hypothetical protein
MTNLFNARFEVAEIKKEIITNNEEIIPDSFETAEMNKS